MLEWTLGCTWLLERWFSWDVGPGVGISDGRLSLHLLFVDLWGWKSGEIWFLTVILAGIPPVVIRNAQHLVLRWLFFFFFFLLHGCEENLPVLVDFLKVSCVCTFFLQYSPQDLSWRQLSLTVPKICWIGGTRKRRWSSCSYRKCPQGAALSHTQLGFLRQPEPKEELAS